MRCCCCCKIFAVSARIVAFHYQLRSWFGAFVDKFTEEHCIVKHCNALHCGVPVHCGKHCIVDQWAVERMQCVFWSTSALWSRVRRTGTENWNQIYLGLESNIFGGGYASFYDTEIFTHIKVMQFRYNAVQIQCSSERWLWVAVRRSRGSRWPRLWCHQGPSHSISFVFCILYLCQIPKKTCTQIGSFLQWRRNR